MTQVTEDTSADRARPEAIQAVPVRHPGRWVAVAVIAVLTAMFVHTLVTNERFQWAFIVDNALAALSERRRGPEFSIPAVVRARNP